MSLPNVDFTKLRPHNGSNQSAFEELCCQLAQLDPRVAGLRFHRKGPGADAGVECFAIRADSSEIGWQAKYFSAWGDTQVSDLNDSISTALEKHPRLSTYIVCLHFDFRDGRLKGRTSELDRWNAWKNKWESSKIGKKRRLKIELWGRSQLVSMLTKDDGPHSGRLAYWFDAEILADEWFSHQFRKSLAALGSRYTPETNVDLPIRKSLVGFFRDQSINRTLHNWRLRLLEKGAHCVSALKDVDVEGSNEKQWDGLEAALGDLDSVLAGGPFSATDDIPIKEILDAAAGLLKLVRKATDVLWDADIPSSKDLDKRRNLAVHYAFELNDSIYEVINSLESHQWKYLNHRSLLITGQAGAGKSHLLADVAADQISRRIPALVILGSSFNDTEPWRQILTALDFPPHLRIKHFLGALDAAAEAKGVRAIIYIDALNERKGTEIWLQRLSAFLEEVRPYPSVGVVVSCRTTYLNYVIPDSLTETVLPRIEHVGFAGHATQAAKVYLDKRGISRPGAPSFLSEFENPLFLKTCCDFLEKEGKQEFPRGIRGFTSIFGYYRQAIEKSLERKMGLDIHQKIISRAIDAFTEKCHESRSGYVSKAEAIRCFEEILPSGGSRDRSLLVQLESEGLLSVEPGRDGEAARFTFERFSDHAIASRLLSVHLDIGSPANSFSAGTVLHELIFSKDAFRRAGVIASLSMQIPELTSKELYDLLPSPIGENGYLLEKGFEESLLWRDQTRFTARTLDLVDEHLGDDAVLRTLLLVSTEPENSFNANHLHSKLWPMEIGERDSVWSTYIAESRQYEGHPIETLISWSLAAGMDEIDSARARLVAKTLIWILSTSNRRIRDRATKGLVTLFVPRLALAGEMVKIFADVNDPYVLERLLAAIYGACLQGGKDTELRSIAATVYKEIFSGREPPFHILSRDYARGIIEYSDYRKCLPSSVEFDLVRPKHRQKWSIDFVPEEAIGKYIEDYGNGNRLRDRIVGSCVEDGDFARYIVDSAASYWSVAAIGTDSLPTDRDLAGAWLDHFSTWASKSQAKAFLAWVEASKATQDQGYYEQTPERAEQKIAEELFCSLVGSEAAENFRICARYCFANGGAYSHPVTFPSRWARKWICKRAHDFGWTPELFSVFDRNQYESDRRPHSAERIGKKYQWMAFHELMARLSDHLAMGRSYSLKERMVYDGPWQLSVRDLDPSLLVARTRYDGWKQWGYTWWVPKAPVLGKMTARERLAWLTTDHDLVNDSSLIDVKDPISGVEWTVLESHSSFRYRGFRGQKSFLQRETWFRLNCLICKSKDADSLFSALHGQSLVSSYELPSMSLEHDLFIGEYPWHTAVKDLPDWQRSGGRSKLPVPVRCPSLEYSRETGGYDHSMEETVRVYLPAPWLVEALDLRLTDGAQLNWIDSGGEVAVFDPSVSMEGPGACLIRKDALEKVLREQDLTALWVIAGEKSAYGSSKRDIGFGGRYNHTKIYRRRDDQYEIREFFLHQEPSAEQLAEFLAEE